MRRFLLVLMIVGLMISSAYAVDATLVPFNGAYGINVGSEIYNSEINTANGSYGWIEGIPTKGSGTYNDDSIVAMGEVSGFSLDTDEDFYLRLTINTDSDFNFVSISNPSYYRPYTLTAIGKCTSSGNGQIFVGSQPLEQGKTNVVTFYFRNGGITGSCTDCKIWVDLVLGLPIDNITDSGLLTLPSGEQLVLGRVADYASFVTITMEYGKVGSTEDSGNQVLSIPFSGFYRTNGPNKESTSTASLHVDTNARASALDIRNDAKKEVNIAELRFAQTSVLEDEDRNNTEKITETEEYMKSIRLFLSASSSPTTSYPDGFRLLHADYQAGEPINDYNSVPFVIRARSATSSEMVEFDGTTAIVGGQLVGNVIEPEFHGTNIEVSHAEKKSYYVSYDGSLSLYIDYGGYKMKPGLYQEDVYVHVVAEK